MNSTTPSEQDLVRLCDSRERKNQNNQHSSRVCAVVVTFFPDVELLITVLDRLRTQVANVIVVNNTPTNREASSLEHTQIGTVAEVIALGLNQGIAAAHNVGIKWSRKKGYSHVLLMDQDSVPAPDMVARLLAAGKELQASGELVAALAPQFFDPKFPERASFSKRDGWRIRKISCQGDSQALHRLEYAISSGTLIALDVLDEVGDMDEELFIDYVDIEWGLRAQAKGYHSFGVCGARLEHQLGDSVVTFRWAKNFSAPVHTPVRHYYHFRNAIHVYKRSYASLPWTLNDAYRLLLKYVFYATVTPPRWQHFKMMTLGIWHGLRGRVGPLPLTGP